MARWPKEKPKMVIVIREGAGDSVRLDYISKVTGGYLKGPGSRFSNRAQAQVFLARMIPKLRARGFTVELEDDTGLPK